MDTRSLAARLADITGPRHVSVSLPDRVAYGADMWPRAQIWKSGGEVLRHPPDAIVHVGNRNQVKAVLELCRAQGVPVIPYGAGSGVCGGTVPLRGGVILDLKRMNRVIHLDRTARLLTVEAGALGKDVEDYLNESGFTLGHFPSSLYCSSIGGYAAARSAGQCSSRYGVFADMVAAATVVLPDGRSVSFRDTGPGGGPDWLALFLGSEGTLGVVTDVTLRIHPAPERRAYHGFEFRDVEHGLAAMRALMQAGHLPAVLRLYDPFDTLIAASEPPPPHAARAAKPATAYPAWFARLLEGRLAPLVQPVWGDLREGALHALLRRPAAINVLADRLPVGCLLVTGFEGREAAVAAETRAAHALLAAAGGRDRGPGPGEAWAHNRFAVSFKQPKVFVAGAFVDTMEVSAPWETLPGLYRAVRAKIGGHAFIMGHFSHAYREGCSIYFTFVGRRSRPEDAAALHERLWQDAMTAVDRASGSISHHHGVGIAKRQFLPAEHGAGGAAVFASLKRVLDPSGVLNPDKLWEAPRPCAEPPRPDEALAVVGAVRAQSQVALVGAAMPLSRIAAALRTQGYELPFFTVGHDDDPTLRDALAVGTALDWGPRLGPPHKNLMGVTAHSPTGQRLDQRPAPRRAMGPDLAGAFLGGAAFGALDRLWLRVSRRDDPTQRVDWAAPTAAPLIAALRTLFDHDVRPARVALARAHSGPVTLHLLLAGPAQRLADERGRTAALKPDRVWAQTAPAPWPELPPDGFARGVPLDFAALEARLASACDTDEPFVVGRVGLHEAWVVAPESAAAGRPPTTGPADLSAALAAALSDGV